MPVPSGIHTTDQHPYKLSQFHASSGEFSPPFLHVKQRGSRLSLLLLWDFRQSFVSALLLQRYSVHRCFPLSVRGAATQCCAGFESSLSVVSAAEVSTLRKNDSRGNSGPNSQAGPHTDANFGRLAQSRAPDLSDI